MEMLSVYLVVCIVTSCLARPIEIPRTRRSVLDPDRYLERFGYLASGSLGTGDDFARSAAISDFQKMVGINQTGFLNEETLTWMRKPRCGLPDKVPDAGTAADIPDGTVVAQAYTVPGSKWTKNRLTYKIHNYSPDLDRYTQRRAFWRAFKFWSDVANLEFAETYGNADINIKFSYYDHGDGSYNAFDGMGGILAHAFFPESGETHFDEGETWTDGENLGTNLLNVATHELGHALGLAHSQVWTSLMAPYYQGYNPNFKLHPDDIAGVQVLYGPKPRPVRPTTTTTRGPYRPRPRPQPTTTTTATTRRPTTTTTRRPYRPRPTPSTPQPDPCTTKFDAVFYGPDHKVYVLRNKWVFRLSSRGVERGYPKLLTSVFNGSVPINVGGAVFSRRTRRLYLFKGKIVWRYQFSVSSDTFSIDPGFPRTMTSSRYPQSVEAAIADRVGRIHLFWRGYYYTFSEYYLTVERYEPRIINSRFNGIPTGVEAAVRLRDGYMYFFKGTNYRKYLDGYGVVAGPKPKAGPWMACGGAEPK